MQHSSRANLALDFGNTRLKFGVFEDSSSPVETGFIDRDDDESIHALLRENRFGNLIWSSVVSLGKNWLELMNNSVTGRAVRFERSLNLNVSIDYKTPTTLGNDRLANACGAAQLYSGQKVLVIDCGTCLKCDLVDAEGRYLGGSISPGLSMRFRAMNNFTDRLPLIDVYGSAGFPGKSTDESMRTGTLRGMIHEINGFIEESEAEVVVITGGDYPHFEKALKNIIFAHPFLTLQGLNAVLQLNMAQ